MSSQFVEFPKKMSHPEHAAAVFRPLTAEEKAMKGLFAPVPQCISPERFPEVTVFTIDQEKQYASKGYRPNNMSNAEDYNRIILESQPVKGYQFNAFPKWKYHAIEIPVIVKSAEEERALGDGWHDAPVVATEDDLLKVSKPAKHAAAKPKVAKPKAKKKPKVKKLAKVVKPAAKPAGEQAPA